MNEVQEDGATKRAHLIKGYEANGVMPEELVQPEFPQSVSYLWGYFAELSSSRGSNGFGVNPISFRDFKDWMDVHRIRLLDWEYDAIRKLDQEWLSWFNEKAKKDGERNRHR